MWPKLLIMENMGPFRLVCLVLFRRLQIPPRQREDEPEVEQEVEQEVEPEVEPEVEREVEQEVEPEVEPEVESSESEVELELVPFFALELVPPLLSFFVNCFLLSNIPDTYLFRGDIAESGADFFFNLFISSSSIASLLPRLFEVGVFLVRGLVRSFCVVVVLV
jgi:hypothetical protein